MAIRKLTYDKGDALGIHEKGEKLDAALVLKYLDDNLQNEEQLIVKCGKSFWDVTNAPEIFEAGEEFTPEDLTAIDEKQYGKTDAAKPAFAKTPEEEKEDRLNLLFQKTDKEPEETPEKWVRKTYYLREKDVEALSIMCHVNSIEVSAMVREVFERGLTSIADEIEYGDVYAEAEENIAKRGFAGKKKALKSFKR